MNVWIIWEDDYNGSWPVSIHLSEATARAEAERLADDDWASAKAEHDLAETRRIDAMGSWVFETPIKGSGGFSFEYASGTMTSDDGTVYQAVWKRLDPRPEPTPYTGRREGFVRRIDSYEVVA